MRFLYSLLFSGIIILTAGCSMPVGLSSRSTPDISLTAPMQSGLDPVQIGKQLLEEGGRRWLETPVPVVVKKMSYAEAHNWIPMLSQEGDQFWGSETPVWLVVLKGSWIPNDPAQANPQLVTYPGCLLVLFRAADGRLIAEGDSLCSGQQ